MADINQWQLPRNEAGKLLGWSDNGRGMANHGIGEDIQAHSDNLDTLAEVMPGSTGLALLAATNEDDAAAAVGLPAKTANTMLVDNAAGTERESKTFEEVRALLDLSGKYNGALPYNSQMNRFKAIGITPEDVDTGNEIGNDADAGIPLREMLVQGIGDGISKFRLASGET